MNNKHIKFDRKLHDDSPVSADYFENTESVYQLSCHCGRKKLLYSEIEYYVFVSRYVDLSECVAVYIGASPGYHQEMIFDMFPTLSFIFFDIREFKAKIKDSDRSRITVIDGKEGYFDDSKINKVIGLANGKKIIYLSDIRSAKNDQAIFADLLGQQRWAIKMKSDFIMLKMRLPFLNPDTDLESMKYDFGELAHDIIYNDNEIKEKKFSMAYLSGNIYYQLLEPSGSAETRLITGKLKYLLKDQKDKLSESYDKMGDKYMLKNYDIRKYDNQLAYFNRFVRNAPTIYENSFDVKNHLYGYDDGYDSVAQYYIIKTYYKNLDRIHGSKKPLKDKIFDIERETIRTMYDIDILSLDFSLKFGFNLLCVANNMLAYLADSESKYNTKMFKSRYENIIESIKFDTEKINRYYDNYSTKYLDPGEINRYIDLVDNINQFIVIKDNKIILTDKGIHMWNKLRAIFSKNGVEIPADLPLFITNKKTIKSTTKILGEYVVNVG